MPSLNDITGNKYNSLTVIEQAEHINGRVAWKCECDCGKFRDFRTGCLTTGRAKNCGMCDWTFEQNMYTFKDSYVKIYDPKGRYFLIDEEDILKIKHLTWHVDHNGYTSCSIKGKGVSLHRFLLNPKANEIVDHINNNPSDNRKINLRICDIMNNMWNTRVGKNNKTGVKGVYIAEITKKNKEIRYGAEITSKGRKYHLYSGKDFKEAVRRRYEAELEHFGEFANIENIKAMEKILEINT